MGERDFAMRGFGFSLRDGTNPLSCKWYDDLRACKDFAPLWGADGTGDVCSPSNVADAAKKVGRQAAIIVADGGFGVASGSGGEHLENYQEVVSSKIVLAEVLLMLETLRAGGCFVCKLFDTFSHISASLLFITAALFEETFVVKPRHSRLVNSERYLVGKGFHAGAECLTSFREAVRRTLDFWPDPLTTPGGFWGGCAPVSVLDPATVLSPNAAFLESVRTMATTLCQRQTSALEAVLDRVEAEFDRISECHSLGSA